MTLKRIKISTLARGRLSFWFYQRCLKTSRLSSDSGARNYAVLAYARRQLAMVATAGPRLISGLTIR